MVPLTSDAPLLTRGPGDVILIGGTRVPLDTVVEYFLAGSTAEEIALDFPSLQLADVYGAISHYLRHRAEIDAYLASRRVEGERIQVEIEERFPSIGLRERLLARRSKGKQI